MDIKHLQYFIEAVNCKSFTRAADRLFITQPTISKMVKNLEEELGVQLFERSRKKLILTDAGQVIYDQAKLIDKAFTNLQQELDELRNLKKGVIRLGLPPIIGTSFFPKMIGAFHKKYPDITFHLAEHGSKRIEEEVASGILHAGVVVLPANEDAFETLPYKEENFRLVLHPEHPFAHRQEIELPELKREPFILFNKDFVLHDRILSACSKAGFQPKVVSESSQWEFIEEMIACGLGAALFPESICQNLSSKVCTLKIVNPSITWKLAVIWKKEQYLPFAAREWLSYTRNQLL
ncbi:LysR family transcriptional regulator [Bacillus mangrovi]|uniref:LysR family transcriptional regulator n=1 Tax=Metabacillus mangrovi TaxID=1491830 RepID=A0A7X2S6R8_9BACI|nr:LysR family transcriptional regulator [Metabacillus mangrovi]MTH54677.1 LysR family transcriptional regulator [Metabacillus mangrovi]